MVLIGRPKEVQGEYCADTCIQGAIGVDRKIQAILLLAGKQCTEITLRDLKNITGNVSVCFLVDFRAGFLVRPFDQAKQVALWLVQQDL